MRMLHMHIIIAIIAFVESVNSICASPFPVNVGYDSIKHAPVSTIDL